MNHRAFLGILALTAGLASPQERFPFVGVITADRVYIRAGGGRNYAVLHTARKGELVEVHGVGGARNGWYRCRYPRPLLAYIVTRYVRRVKPEEGVLEANRVNLRPTPSLKRAPITQLRAGTRLRITGRKGDFYEVIVPPEVFVWIHRDYVRRVGTLAEYEKRLAAVRAEAWRRFRPPVPPPAKKAPGKGAAGKGAATVGDAEAARTARLARLAALEKAWAGLAGSKEPAPLEAFLGKLQALDREAAAAEDAYARFKVNQLITKVRVRLVELRHAVRRRRPAARPQAGAVVTHTGWIKKDVEPLQGRIFYKLVKGDVVLCELRTQRYDLERFVERHVAVTGRRRPRRGALERVVLEVVRLRVLTP